MAMLLKIIPPPVAQLLFKLAALRRRIAMLTRPRVTLLSLPTEILQQIARELPLDSVMSLSLTSKKFHSILSPQAALLAPDGDATYTFLKTLLRDMGSIYLCKACNKFYEYRKAENGYIAKCPHMKVTWPLTPWTEQVIGPWACSVDASTSSL
jgi:F-box-like